VSVFADDAQELSLLETLRNLHLRTTKRSDPCIFCSQQHN